jgi:hypothetical protein
MAYNMFTLNQLRKEYGLVIARQPELFATVPPTPISDFLRLSLAKHTDVALRSRSEKARSEYIIAPILAEVYERTQDRANLFSGVEFKVDESRGLAGYCDFLFTLAPLAIDIQAPVVSIVEAKKEDIVAGIPQCLAELVAAQIFNAAEGYTRDTLYGIVTSGTEWKFLSLQGVNATIDDDTYFLDNVEKIVGIALSMLQ